MVQLRENKKTDAMYNGRTGEQEALLSQSQQRGQAGRTASDRMRRLYLRGNDRFLAEVEEGLVAAERGEFIEEDEIDAHIERCSNVDAYPLDVACSRRPGSDQAYLDTHYPQFSRSTVRKLYDGIRSLKVMPERGRIGFQPGTREIVFPPLPYLVVYRFHTQAVEKLRIYHGAQDRTEH